MNSSMRLLMSVAVAVFGVSAMRADAQPSGAGLRVVPKGLELFSDKDPLDPRSCNYQGDHGHQRQCHVDVHVSVDAATGVCSAEVRGYLSVPRRQPRTIVWTLVPSTIGSDRFEFATGHGIDVVRDDFKQVKGHSKTKGGHGDDDATVVSKSKFFWFNRNTRPSGNPPTVEIFYLPNVYRFDSAGKPTVCQAIDPKIVNDQ